MKKRIIQFRITACIGTDQLTPLETIFRFDNEKNVTLTSKKQESNNKYKFINANPFSKQIIKNK